MAEMAMNMEARKGGAGQRIKELFNTRYAKEKWLADRQEMIKKYADVNNGLSDEQRVQVMTQIENDATNAAKIQVRNHWLALVGSTAVLAAATVGVAKPEWVEAFAGKLKDVNIKGRNFGLGKVGEGLSHAANTSHDFLADMWSKAGTLKEKAFAKLKTIHFGKAKAPPVV